MVHYLQTSLVLLFAIWVTYYSDLFPRNMTSVVTTTLNVSYDYVIVGGGSAGCVLASRLSEDPATTVLLIEAGGDYTENPAYHVPLGYFSFRKSAVDWESTTIPQKHSHFGMTEQRSFWSRGKVLGGSGIINGMQYVRGSRHDYDKWEALGATGWGYKDVLPYFLKSEDMRIEGLKSSRYHQTGGYIAVSSGKITSLANMFLEAGRELGYNIVDYNGEVQEGFGENQINVRDGVRSSTALEFLGRHRERSNLHVAINSFVTKLKIDNAVAQGVSFIRNLRNQFVKANKEVIVSAGAVGSPQLLMLSGIGPKSHLEEFGIPVLADLPVGDNLQDHLTLLTMSSLNGNAVSNSNAYGWFQKLQHNLFGKGIFSVTGVETTGFLCTYANANKSSKGCAADIQFLNLGTYMSQNIFDFKEDIANEVLNQDPNTPGLSIAICLIDPKSTGTLRLKSTDPYDHPLIDPQYLADLSDVRAFIRGIRFWEKYISTPVMQSLGANLNHMKLKFCSHHKFRSVTYWECVIRHLAGTMHHPAGTCKMGREDDPATVLNHELKVKGIKNLRVVDASVMPNIVSGNTNAAVVMIAEKAADMIRGKDTVKQFRNN